MKKYIIDLFLATSNGFVIQIEVQEENSELALNKVQGMLYQQDGWIHIVDTEGSKFRIRGNNISHIGLNKMMNYGAMQNGNN